ncbi:MAG: cytochrome P450 [Paracoccaceae bacterium]|nr:cytochrome P450 [Paracoccaceae bacterium]
MTTDAPAQDSPAPDAPFLIPESGLVRIPFKSLMADPHGMFRAARALGPVAGFSDGSAMLLRAADVQGMFGDPRIRQIGVEGMQAAGVAEGPFLGWARETLLLSHGRDHVRRRTPLARAFAYPLMNTLRPSIRRAAHRLIADWTPGETVDLRDSFAAQLPARTIAEILGAPEEDVPDFTALVYRMTKGLAFGTLPDQFDDIHQAASELHDYVDGLLADRRAHPRDDFLSAYVARVDADGDLSPSEIIAQIVTVIIGGADTTRAAMTALVSLLMDHRAQWDLVCADPEMAAGAVAEGLRYEPSIGSIPVFTLEPIEASGVVIPAYRVLSLSMMSAMRDEALYSDPDRFDITRTDHPRLHLVFGGGPHRCLGEALARAELEEGLIALTQAWPNLRRTGPAVRMSGMGGIRTASPLTVVPAA